MARSLNRVQLIGNLGADPEVRSTANGGRVANLSLATSRQWKGASGDKQEKTEWHRVVIWNNKGSNLADIAERYCKKGDKISELAGQGRPDPVHDGDQCPRVDSLVRQR